MFFLSDLMKFISWPRNPSSLYRVSFWILLIIVVGLIAATLQLSVVIWSLGALACGGLLGFLFGVPRVQQAPISSTEVDIRSDYRQTVNTNLTEISDWLTKIIVGVSLVQMARIPIAFQSLVQYLSESKYDPGFVGGVLVFFGVTGFISGYLLTRLFLATAFSESDRAANEFNRKTSELEPSGSVPTGDAEASIRRSPRDAVLTHWNQLYAAARSAIAKRDPDNRVPRLAKSLISQLSALEILDAHKRDTIKTLYELRNVAAHSSDDITEEAAADYVGNALRLIESLNAISRES